MIGVVFPQRWHRHGNETEMIGTTRSRVSSFMNKFRKLGSIDYNGKLEVRSSLLNFVLHDEPHIKGQQEGGREEGP